MTFDFALQEFYQGHLNAPVAQPESGLRPQPGDLVILTGSYWITGPGDVGVIQGAVNTIPDELQIIFGQNRWTEKGLKTKGGSCYRDMFVSAGVGGPGAIVRYERLTFKKTILYSFWKWNGIPCVGGEQTYQAKIRVWKWDGNE